MPADAEKFRQFEHAGWQGIPDGYHRAFGDLTTQAIEPLLDAVGAAEGLSLLDIASGPGYVAARAAERGARVCAIDFSTAMVAAAGRLHPRIDFREGDAEDLPFDKGIFDLAVMNFGILHLGRPDKALAEAQRVLRAGGRFAFTAWAKPEEAVGFGIVLRAIETFGTLRVGLPEGPPFFRFSDPAECVKALLAAGFEAPAVAGIPQVWRLPSVDSLFEFMRESTVRTAGLLRAQTAAALDSICRAIRDELEKYRKGASVELPMPAVLATATKKS
jgi:ubiquinone/menaquinone biosynthesis C-methylase UbiE